VLGKKDEGNTFGEDMSVVCGGGGEGEGLQQALPFHRYLM
jgi:hypothetical protein